MAKTSLHVMKTYRLYNRYISREGHLFYFTGDFVTAPGKTYYLPFYFSGDFAEGPWKWHLFPERYRDIEVHPGDVKLFTYIDFLIKEKWPVRFLLMINSLSMSSDLDLNPEREDYYSEISWNTGATIFAYRPIKTENSQLTIGVQANFEPYLVADSLGNDRFGVYYDVKDSIYKGTVEHPQLFLHLEQSGYDFGTMYDAQRNIIQLLELAKYFALRQYRGRLGTQFRYLDFLKTYQAGFHIRDFPLIHRTLLGSSFMWNIFKDGQWNTFSAYTANTSITLGKNVRADQNHQQKHPFTTIDAGISFSREIYDDLLIGGTGEIIFHRRKPPNRKVWYDWGIGASYNYYDHMIRLPLRDVTLWHIFFTMYL